MASPTWAKVEIAFDDDGRLLLRTKGCNPEFLSWLKNNIETLESGAMIEVDEEKQLVILTGSGGVMNVIPTPPPPINTKCDTGIFNPLPGVTMPRVEAPVTPGG